MHVIFTDLDGTLLEHHSYSWAPARRVIERLNRQGIPYIFVTSKTKIETCHWRAAMGNTHPFVIENGGAVYVPSGYFPFPLPGSSSEPGYDVLQWGSPYPVLVSALGRASRESGCRVRGFSDMPVGEVAAACGLAPDQAAWAKQRGYDEPFEILDPHLEADLLAAIERQGLRWTRGGRFWHLCGRNDKALAVETLAGFYAQAFGAITTIGLGDAWNDLTFLNLVDRPVVIQSPAATQVAAQLPRALLTSRSGPEGWAEALETLLAEPPPRAVASS